MKKVTFLVTHLGSGSGCLTRCLGENPRVQCYQSGLMYTSPYPVQVLTSYEHKCRNSAAIWLDEHVYNYSFCCKELYERCKFIYLIREARGSLEELTGVHLYEAQAAMRHYCYRLRRIAEMARRTRGAVLLTHDDLEAGKGADLIEELLNLKEPLRLVPPKTARSMTVSTTVVDTAQRCYERYLYKLRQMDLHAVVRNAEAEGEDMRTAVTP